MSNTTDNFIKNKHDNTWIGIITLVTTLCIAIPFLVGYGGVLSTTPLGIGIYAYMLFTRLQVIETIIPISKHQFTNVVRSSLDILGLLFIFYLIINMENNQIIVKLLSQTTLRLLFLIFSTTVEIVISSYSVGLIIDYIIRIRIQQHSLNLIDTKE